MAAAQLFVKASRVLCAVDSRFRNRLTDATAVPHLTPSRSRSHVPDFKSRSSNQFVVAQFVVAQFLSFRFTLSCPDRARLEPGHPVSRCIELYELYPE
jgi:hypothetical protein